MLVDKLYCKWAAILITTPLIFSMSQSAELKEPQVTSGAFLDFRIVIPATMRVIIKNSSETDGVFGVHHPSISLEMSGNFQSVLIIKSAIDSTQMHLLEETADVAIDQRNTNVNEVLSNYGAKGQVITTRIVATRTAGIPGLQRKIQYLRQLNLITGFGKDSKERIVYTFVAP